MENYDLILLSVALFGLTLIFGGLYIWVQMGEKSSTSRSATREGSGGNTSNASRSSNGLRRRRTGNNDTNEEEEDDASVLAGLDPGSKQYKKRCTGL